MNNVKSYFATWWTIMARPIYFYTKLKEESWKEKSLTFLLYTAWLIALALTLAIFIIQYIPIGSTLVAGITGLKMLIVSPVLVTLAFMFFLITFLIMAGVMTAALGILFGLVGWLTHYVYIVLGGKGSLNRMVQSVLYSCAAMTAMILPAAFAVLTRYNALDFSLFRVGYNFIYFLTSLYLYGLWAVAGRKNYDVNKTRAFIGALAPVIILLIFGFIFDKLALSKLQSWIAPLK
ncbi:MAG: hypothetical protein PHH14_01205 [Candidatus Margulisbacteria bacterium]|nr:hypothetical protein [Candidatus Margulisiibacteriota bacterium]